MQSEIALEDSLDRTDQLQQRLRRAQSFLFFVAGGSVTLFALALYPPSVFSVAGGPAWVLVWLAALALPTLTGLALLLAPAWRGLPLAARKTTAWSALALGWLAAFTLALETLMARAYVNLSAELPDALLYGSVAACAVWAVGLVALRRWLERATSAARPEDLFP